MMIPAPVPDDWMGPPPGMDLPSAAALQDEMLTASHDLWRLRSMLSGGLNQLTELLIDAFGQMADLGATAPDKAEALRETLKKAVASLQIQDMAEQLVDHLQTRLNRCADMVADAALGDSPIAPPPPLRPSPVARDDRDGGSVELF